MWSVHALRGRGKPSRLHVGKLIGEDHEDGGLVIYVVGEVHENRVCADVWVFGRVYSCEVWVLDEYRAMCRRQRGEGERALHVLAGRRMVEADEDSVKDVVAVGCCGVDALVDFAGVEGVVMVVADGEGDDVRGRRL